MSQSEKFNRDLAYWLLDQKDILTKNISQKELFELYIDKNGETILDNVALIKKVIEQYTVLSFIIKDNSILLEKLTDYLNPNI